MPNVVGMDFAHEAHAKFLLKSWRESVVEDIDGEGTTVGGVYYPARGFTKAETEYSYEGDVQGISRGLSLISYQPDATPFYGFERFEGSIGGRVGSCVFQHVGTQHQGAVRDRLVVVPGLGTGDLANLRGEAEIVLDGHRDDGYPVILHYGFG